jgi:hypothetical protein
MSKLIVEGAASGGDGIVWASRLREINGPVEPFAGATGPEILPTPHTNEGHAVVQVTLTLPQIW